MSTGTGALQTTYPGQKRADKGTFNRRILLTKKDRNRPMKMTDFARVFQPIPLRLNYRLISTIQYLQRLFIHKKITPARLACLCFYISDIANSPSFNGKIFRKTSLRAYVLKFSAILGLNGVCSMISPVTLVLF